MIAKVILNNRQHNIDQCFDYEIPAQMEVSVGCRVEVLFGRGNFFARGIVVEITKSSYFKNLKEIRKVLDKEPFVSESILNLCLWVKEKYFCSFYQALRLFLPPGLESGAREKTARYANLKISEDEALSLAEDMLSKRAKVQGQMLKALCEIHPIKVTELYTLSGGNASTLSSLAKKGLVEIFSERVYREAYNKNKYKPSENYVPTPEQKKVIDHLKNNISASKTETILLRGVTGSGKTEVFLQAIDHCIKQGKTAIMLVPEISLTPQTVNRFVSRFGESVAVIHSRLSQGERFDEWNKIKNGEVSVVVGARSAIFAPFENIGIIILDEEHETSYKSDTTPKYHAKDIAEKRAKESGATVLLASATPSLHSFYKAQNGEYTLFEMTHRYNEMELPEVKIVDMRGELFNHKNFSPLSLTLQREIAKNLENKTKTILFLNRRGYSTFTSCRECGYVLECTDCSVSMTYHKHKNTMVCHYCGKEMPVPEICPECGSRHIKFFGTGTQKIEETLLDKFPTARVLRMDTDTTSHKGGHEEILSAFGRGEADILVGTQMVTKGLDFPDVTLVGVLAADTSLCMDDFRASEKSFSLLTQVCGRAGRGEIKGRAIIQTYQPQNSTVVFAKDHDYLSFYESEIASRKRLNYPPFCDIISIMASGENEENTAKFMEKINLLVKDYMKTNDFISSVIGPSSAPLSKIKNQYRYRMLLKADSEKIHPLLKSLSEIKEDAKKVFLSIDINPTNML
ncbi:MAG: primosomal protein N' [Clostridia bacterium]|nr:primosomal protein N' [Clostridia bacterium]